MPLLPLIVGQITVAVVTIGWGIWVETRYSGKWTIFFNVVALIVMFTTLDLDVWLYVAITVYVIVAIAVVMKVKAKPWKHRVRHLFGNKGYGSLALAIGISEAEFIRSIDVLPAWIIISIIVYIAWYVVRKVKGAKED